MLARLLLMLSLLFPFAAAQAEEGAWKRLTDDGAGRRPARSGKHSG